MYKNNKKAFTLIELIVVIAILMILVLLAVPKYLEYTAKAELAHIKNDTKVVDLLMDEYLINERELPSEWDPVDIEVAKNENKLFSKEGAVEPGETIEGEFVEIDSSFVAKRSSSKLTGTFVTNSNGDVYYISDKSIEGASNNTESKDDGCPMIPDGEMKPIDIPIDMKVIVAIYDEDPENIEQVEMTLGEYIASTVEPDKDVLNLSYERDTDKYYVKIISDNNGSFQIVIIRHDDFNTIYGSSGNEGSIASIDPEKYFLRSVMKMGGESIVHEIGNPDLIPSYLQNYDDSGVMVGCPTPIEDAAFWDYLNEDNVGDGDGDGGGD